MERYREAAAPNSSSRFLPFVSFPPETAELNESFRTHARARRYRVDDQPRAECGGLFVCPTVRSGGAHFRAPRTHAGRAAPRQSVCRVGRAYRHALDAHGYGPTVFSIA